MASSEWTGARPNARFSQRSGKNGAQCQISKRMVRCLLQRNVEYFNFA